MLTEAAGNIWQQYFALQNTDSWQNCVVNWSI